MGSGVKPGPRTLGSPPSDVSAPLRGTDSANDASGLAPAVAPAGLSTPRRPNAHIAYLDGLRALAVVAIFLRHAWGLSGSPHIPFLGLDLSPLMVMLSSGVDLFFVLSGFLLARSFLRAEQTGRPAPRLGAYWRARIRRIGPPFWVVLLVVVLFMTPTFIPESKVFSKAGLAIFLAHVPILQTTYMPAFGAYPVETPFWTLTIEVIFYLTLPFIVRLFFGKRWILFTPLLGLVALAWLFWVRNDATALVHFENSTINVFPPFEEPAVRFFLSHQFPAFLVDFSMGILAAAVVVSKQFKLAANARFQQVTSPSAGLLLFTGGVVALIATMWVLGTLSIRYGYANPLNYMYADRRPDLVYYYMETIPFGIAFGMVLLGLALGPARLKAIFSFRGLAFFGVIGYSVYLLHFPILSVVGRYEWIASDTDPSSHFLKMFFFAAPLTIVVSYAFYRVVEQPSIAWSQRVRGGRPERSEATAVVTRTHAVERFDGGEHPVLSDSDVRPAEFSTTPGG